MTDLEKALDDLCKAAGIQADSWAHLDELRRAARWLVVCELVSMDPPPIGWEGVVVHLTQAAQPRSAFVCTRCNDTHSMTLGDREVMCTRCPTPCVVCSRGPYCRTTPCPCFCHRKGP